MQEKLKDELLAQSIKPPEKDIRIAKFSLAMTKLIEEPGPKSLIDTLVERNNGIQPSYAVNILLRVFQKQLIKKPDYPKHFDTRESWEESIKLLLKDDETVNEIVWDLKNRNVQSNVVERYKATKLVLHLLTNRLSEQPSILDIGCSRNHGLKKISLNLPFSPIACKTANFSEFSNLLIDSLFNSAINKYLTIDDSVGVDLIDLKDQEDAIWAKSCSFYPSELLNKSKTTEYDFLDANDVKNVKFNKSDATSISRDSVPPDNQFDIVTASTFLYQLSEIDRHKARLLMQKYVSPKGVIIYQDFVSPSKNHKELVFAKYWLPYTYRTLIEFANQKDYLYELIRWSNGRCHDWIPGDDLDEAIEHK